MQAFLNGRACFLAKWGGVLATFDHICMKMKDLHQKMGEGMCTAFPFNQISCKNTETNIVFNDDYIVINYIET